MLSKRGDDIGSSRGKKPDSPVIIGIKISIPPVWLLSRCTTGSTEYSSALPACSTITEWGVGYKIRRDRPIYNHPITVVQAPRDAPRANGLTATGGPMTAAGMRGIWILKDAVLRHSWPGEESRTTHDQPAVWHEDRPASATPISAMQACESKDIAWCPDRHETVPYNTITYSLSKL